MARDSSSFQPRFAARETELSRRRRCDGALLDACHELSEPLTALANYLAVERRLIDRGEEIGAAGIAEILGKMSAQVSRAGRTLARLRQLLRDGPDEPSSDAGEQAARPHLIDPHELRKLAAWYRIRRTGGRPMDLGGSVAASRRT